MKVSVIGCGRWGSFIAYYLDKIGHSVALYGREEFADFQRFKQTRTNGMVTLRDTLELSSDLNYIIERADAFVISIGSQNLRGFLGELDKGAIGGRPVILCMKGIEEDTGLRLTQIVEEVTGCRDNVAIWVGPGHVQEFTKGVPNCMVIDSLNDELKRKLVEEFQSPLIRYYYGCDLIGNEIGAASKNVIGIAAGMLDGLEKSSLKGALMSRATREISRLIGAMGGSEMTAYGLSHLGDYEATVFSQHSHNRAFGEIYVRGGEYTQLAEGVYTAKAMKLLGERYGVDLPICNSVYDVIYEKKDPEQTLIDLFIRPLKQEF